MLSSKAALVKSSNHQSYLHGTKRVAWQFKPKCLSFLCLTLFIELDMTSIDDKTLFKRDIIVGGV